MKITRFEDIESWKEGRELAQLIYRAARKGKFRRDFALSDQICRAVVSITSNIAEGFESQSNIEFIRFLIYSRRSASEVKSQCYIALDKDYITQNEFDEIYEKASLISKLINGFVAYLRKNKYKRTQ